jgi:hypothetical protein
MIGQIRITTWMNRIIHTYRNDCSLNNILIFLLLEPDRAYIFI